MTLRLQEALSIFTALPRTPAAVVVALDASSGRIVLTQTLREAIEETVGGRTTDEAVRTACRRARAAIKGYGRIESSYGVGYSLHWDRPLPTEPQPKQRKVK